MSGRCGARHHADQHAPRPALQLRSLRLSYYVAAAVLLSSACHAAAAAAKGGGDPISAFPSGWRPRLPTRMEDWAVKLPSFFSNPTTDVRAALTASGGWADHPVFAPDGTRVPWRLADLEPALAVTNHEQLR